ncbi:O-antigen ligase family protein [Limimaricola pyoseonensis]|uniref:O-antigen ligase like membrane protein n=1 Tax=Limimaricola pyoseonensis TaxID=521013 RepID=A0A1G7IVS5_9RHOB|nr:O-antigen ligase family protein [Limimaricola pyoseonensis]SDF16753.1 O-antigen ligase like membrane protein [Limimaricola pyoseonensis]
MTASVGASPLLSAAPAAGSAGRRACARLVLVSLVVPVAFEIAGFRLTPSLLVLIALYPMLLMRVLSGRLRLGLVDLLFVLYVGWLSLSMLVNTPGRFVAYTGQQGLAILGGYMAGRVLVRDRADFAALLRFLFWIVALSLPFALIEALADRPLIIELVRDHTPFSTFVENDYEPRLGLYRAQWVFAHPIHYGVFAMLAFAPVVVGLGLAPVLRGLAAVLIGAACLLSVSSGPLLALMFQGPLFLWHRLAARRSARPWREIGLSLGGLYLLLDLLSTKNALVAISTRLALDSSTASYREQIWRYGSAQVARTPWLGVGDNYWARPHWMVSASIDNFWLLLAIVHGLPALVFFGTALGLSLVRINRRELGPDPALQALRLGWTLAMLGCVLVAGTVALWGEILIFVMLMLGAGQWMLNAQPDQGAATPATPNAAPQPDRAGPVFTRFPAAAPPAPRPARRPPALPAPRPVLARNIRPLWRRQP